MAHGAHLNWPPMWDWKLDEPGEVLPRVSDVEHIVQILQGSDGPAGGGEQPFVLPLVGEPGIGKTTLARLVFSHPWAASTFDVRCWIDWPRGKYFSEPLDMPAKVDQWLTASIDDKSTSKKFKKKAVITPFAKKRLPALRYLVVIDDVWDVATDTEFVQFVHAFGAARYGTRILVTMSSFGDGATTSIEGAVEPYLVRRLSPQNAWELFAASSSLGLVPAGDDPQNHQLTAIAKEIVLLCGGVTFLIAHFHYILSGQERTIDAWQRVLDGFEDHCSFCDTFFCWNNHIFNVLPPPYQMCLLHCAQFRRNYVFDMAELMDLWVAEGFLDPPSQRNLMHRPFDALLEEWFYRIHPVPVGSSNHNHHNIFAAAGYKMRPHLHLALQRIPHGCKITPEASWILPSAQLVYLIVDSKACKIPKVFFKLQHLEKLILFPEEDTLSSTDKRCEITEVPRKLCRCTELLVLDMRATRIRDLPPEFSALHKLTYLNLSRTDLVVVPEPINKLRNLKHLSLSYTNISVVPEFVGMLTSLVALELSHCEELVEVDNALSNLASLEKLDLQGCYCLPELPPGMSNMRSLVYLSIQQCSSLAHMPVGISQLAGLEVLLGYVVGEALGQAISELKPLGKLKVLALENLENVLQVQDARDASLNEKQNLESLSLRWGMDVEADPSVLEQVIESLQPNQCLKVLEIFSYTGSKFPRWITRQEHALNYLLEIKLFNLKACETLPPLGQLPLLKIAEINGMDKISSIDDAFYGENGSFPSLEKLVFSYMCNLEIWPHYIQGGNMFPRLTDLTVIQCPRFVMLCMKLKSVAKLNLLMNNRLLYSTRGGLQGVARSIKSVSVCMSPELSASEGCKALRQLGRIEELEICSCQELTSIPDGLRYLVSLRCLRVANCTRLESLPRWLASIPSLTSLSILDCPLLEPLPESLSGRLLLGHPQCKVFR